METEVMATSLPEAKKQKYAKNKSPEFLKLNDIVLTYQKHKNGNDLINIIKLTIGLRYKVLNMYFYFQRLF